MESIISKLQDVVKAEKQIVQKNEQVKGYQQASEDFKALVERGMARHRGYQLISSEEAHTTNTKNFFFNTPL